MAGIRYVDGRVGPAGGGGGDGGGAAPVAGHVRVFARTQKPQESLPLLPGSGYASALSRPFLIAPEIAVGCAALVEEPNDVVCRRRVGPAGRGRRGWGRYRCGAAGGACRRGGPHDGDRGRRR